MRPQLTYLETHSDNPSYNLAFEEYVLCNRTLGDYLILWQNANAVIIGQNQNAEAEINRNFVDAHQIQVVRRSTGGGAVYHDLGNLNYSFITDAGDLEQLTLNRFTAPVVDALRQLGLNAETSGRNDILINGRKISGTAQRVIGGRILHHGTLLFDADPQMLEGALQADPLKYQSRGMKSVRSRVSNIRMYLNSDMDLPAFWTYLKGHFEKKGMQTGTLTDEEIDSVFALKQQKYDTWEWNFGKSPPYDLSAKRRWTGGTLEILISVERGILQNVEFYGDFLSLRPLGEISDHLKGCPFQKQAVSSRLDRFHIYEYFGSITQSEILTTMFE